MKSQVLRTAVVCFGLAAVACANSQIKFPRFRAEAIWVPPSLHQEIQFNNNLEIAYGGGIGGTWFRDAQGWHEIQVPGATNLPLVSKMTEDGRVLLSEVTIGSTLRNVIWSRASTQFLQNVSGSSPIYDMNNFGNCVGSAALLVGGPNLAASWNNTLLSALASPSGFESKRGVVISDSGTIFGFSKDNSSGLEYLTRWSKGIPEIAGGADSLFDANSSDDLLMEVGINAPNAALVIARPFQIDFLYHGFGNGSVVSGRTSSPDINENGDVVYTLSEPTPTSFYYRNFVSFDLDQCVDPVSKTSRLKITHVHGINDNGVILARAHATTNGLYTGGFSGFVFLHPVN